MAVSVEVSGVQEWAHYALHWLLSRSEGQSTASLSAQVRQRQWIQRAVPGHHSTPPLRQESGSSWTGLPGYQPVHETLSTSASVCLAGRCCLPFSMLHHFMFLSVSESSHLRHHQHHAFAFCVYFSCPSRHIPTAHVVLIYISLMSTLYWNVFSCAYLLSVSPLGKWWFTSFDRFKSRIVVVLVLNYELFIFQMQALYKHRRCVCGKRFSYSIAFVFSAFSDIFQRTDISKIWLNSIYHFLMVLVSSWRNLWLARS